VHPWYRWLHATSVVLAWDWACDPWSPAWVPPPREGWAWVPGHYVDGTWIPGHWEPIAAGPAGYVYAPGFWVGTHYMAGHWRLAARPGWTWVAASVGADHVVVQGHWEPERGGRSGWTWEPGFWDGDVWVEGFWRPESLADYQWVDAQWDEDGVYHCGYWEPIEDRPGHTWIPGWFDGERWQSGYWVGDEEVKAADPENWSPPEGWDAADTPDAAPAEGEGPEIALPAE
jgi:hypothetical protein